MKATKIEVEEFAKGKNITICKLKELQGKGESFGFLFGKDDEIEFPDRENLCVGHTTWNGKDVHKIVCTLNGKLTDIPISSFRRKPHNVEDLISYPVNLELANISDHYNFVEQMLGKRLKVIDMVEFAYPRFDGGKPCYEADGTRSLAKRRTAIFSYV